MSFNDGFEAIEQIKGSARKLGDAVARIEALEASLADLRKLQTDAETMLDQANATFSALTAAAAGLSSERADFQKLATSLPAMAENVVAEAGTRLIEQQAAFTRLTETFPELVETLIEQKLTAIIAHMETRLSDRLRDELKDTRTTLRDAIDVSAREQGENFDKAKKEIIGEMPRTLFGRRGR